MTTENEMTDSVEEKEEKSFFFRGAVLGLAGGAVAALLLISVAGTVVSLVDDIFGSSTAAAMDDEPVVVDPVIAAGEALATSSGCVACHSTDGLDGVGPSWQGLSASVDAEYIRTAILNPNAVIAAGYTEGVMPSTYADTLSDEDVDALVAYISSL